jgi:glycosyltransferase involved in cell wall biosynthesis
MTPTAPAFSIIIPTYNRGEKIYPTLDSVLAQTHRDFELIVVDDGSTDSTPDALDRYSQRENDPRIKIIRRENGGTTAARNTGIAAATGGYVALLDHDDLWYPWTLTTHRNVIAEFDAPSVIMGRIVDEGSQAATLAKAPEAMPTVQRYDMLLNAPAEGWLVYPSGWTIKTETLRSVGGFFAYNRGFEDLDLMLRLGTSRGYVTISQPAVGIRGLHESNLSSDRHAEWFAKGLGVLLEREQGGQYPGGPDFASNRRKVICSAARSLGVRCIRSGRAGLGWWVYRSTFQWHLRQRRLRFLAGFPTMMTLSFLSKKHRAAAA